MYARVSARSGLDIVFDKEACLCKVNGEEVYSAGFYDPENNRIVIIQGRGKRLCRGRGTLQRSTQIPSYLQKDV